MSAKAKNSYQGQGGENQYLAHMPAHSDFSLPVLFGGLPEASDGRCSGPRVAGNEITRANSSSQIGGFWQVLTLVSASKDRAVSSRSGCRPAGDLFSGGQNQGQSPLSVYSSNSSNRNQMGSEDVFDYNQIFANLNPGKPKEEKTRIADGCCQREGQKHTPEAVGCENTSQGQGHGGDYDNRQNSWRFGDKDLHRPSFTFTGRFMA